jgi:peptidoglycan/LPS O-acetylase OafA/YrhL
MRLFPLLYLMLLMVLGYGLFFRSGTEQTLIVHDVISSAAYVYNICWAWGWGVKELLLYHTWSLGVEEQFYLLWPIVLYAFLKCKQLNLLKYLLAVFIVLVWMLKSMHQFPALASSIVKEAIFIGCLGALIRFTSTKENTINGYVAAVLMLIILVLGIAPLKFTTQYNTVFNVVSLFSIVIILYLVESRSGLLNSLLSNRIIVFVGKISYSLYLWHLPVFRLFYYHSTLTPWVSFAAKFIVSFALAIASWYLVEQKATALGRRWSKKVAAH